MRRIPSFVVAVITVASGSFVKGRRPMRRIPSFVVAVITVSWFRGQLKSNR